MAIRLAATSSPVEIAWAAFDAAALRLNHIYAEIASGRDVASDAKARFELALEVVRLWVVFRDLFAENDGTPGDVA